ncbi:uncharacterized protein V1516DRAFT_677829 [Lipomyces oligophaga]|uniref:uncharacterized protein n=1 Tax=Lipomyces oligophaga TaxID=45792 RepID=UPI0034CFE6AD
MAESAAPTPVADIPAAASAAGGPKAGPPTPENIKGRILKHMNKDHELSLTDYLRFYKGVTPSRNVVLKDITLSSLTLTYEVITNRAIEEHEEVIELNPPMKSMSEARDVLVGMALQASEGLGYSTVSPVDSFLRPTLISVPIIALIVSGLYFIVLAPTAINNPDSILRQFKVGQYSPLPLLIKIAVWIALIYHAGEAFVMYIWTGAYRVPTFKQIAWVLCAFLEGWPALSRFRTLMEEKDQHSEKTKDSVQKSE